MSHISRRQQENCIGEAGSQGQEGCEVLHHSYQLTFSKEWDSGLFYPDCINMVVN